MFFNIASDGELKAEEEENLFWEGVGWGAKSSQPAEGDLEHPEKPDINFFPTNLVPKTPKISQPANGDPAQPK